MQLPSWAAPVSLVTAVLAYIAWAAAASGDSGDGVAVATAISASIFWLALMVFAAALVQRGVARYRDRHRR